MFSGAPQESPKSWKNGTLTYTTGGLVVLFFWLLVGDFAWQLKERSVGTTAMLVLKSLGSPDVLVGLLIGSVPAAIGLILGPIISVRSDNTRSRWGRRIPFLLVPLPVVVLSMFGLAATPHIGAWIHEFLGPRSPGPMGSSLIAFSIFWILFELATIVTNALFGALINDVVPHAIIGRFFGLFRIVSLVDGILFNVYLIKHAEEYYSWIFIGTGLIYGVGFTLMCLMVKEGEYPPPKPQAVSAAQRLLSFKTYLRECFTTPFYLLVFGALISAAVCFGPINSFSIFYAKQLGMDMEIYGRLNAVSYGVSMVMAYFLGMLADKFHPVRMGIVCLALYAAITLWGAFGIVDLTTFSIAFIGHTILSGAYFTSTASIAQRLYPRLKFAQFASGQGILQAVFSGIMPPAVGLFLDLNHHNYRMTFLFSGLLAVAGLVFYTLVYRRFMRLGGPQNYRAPLTETSEFE
jgi:Na+/melibiose symporter-like transporter